MRGAIANQQLMMEVEKRIQELYERVETLEIENDDL